MKISVTQASKDCIQSVYRAMSPSDAVDMESPL